MRAIMTDCFAYNKGICKALNQLYCERDECNFYAHKDTVDIKYLDDLLSKYLKK